MPSCIYNLRHALPLIFLKISANLSLPWLRCHARGRVKAILKKEKLKHQKNSEKKHEKSYYQARLNAFDRVVTKLNAEKGFFAVKYSSTPTICWKFSRAFGNHLDPVNDSRDERLVGKCDSDPCFPGIKRLRRKPHVRGNRYHYINTAYLICLRQKQLDEG